MDCITVEVFRKPSQSWGIQVSGEAPCFIENVKPGSPANDAGIQEGDYIFSVNGVSVHDVEHEEVVRLIAESGRIVRFKILPTTTTTGHQDTFNDDVEESFWTNDVSIDSGNNHSVTCLEDDSDSDDKFLRCSTTSKLAGLEISCSDNSKDSSTKPRSTNYDRKGTAKNDIEQGAFVVTRDAQRNFDDNHVLDCTFAGTKAAAAGAFTGDHNVINDDKNKEEIRGIRSRVKAGVQHFSYDKEQINVNPADKGKIVVYTTSLRIHRSIAQRCDQVRNLFERYRVKFEERDIFNSAEHKDELYRRLGLDDGAPFPSMPRVYIHGVYMGGATELEEMNDCGDLRIRLKEFPKYNVRSKCPTCKGTGLVSCHSCHGKVVRRKNRFAFLKCMTCSQNGKLNCPDCLP